MKKSLQTPQDRRSMLGFGSAAAKLKQQQKKPPEQKRLTFSANRSRLQVSGVGKRWSSQGSHPVKDTRPLSNRSFQKQMVEDILEFLNESGYPHQITAKILSAPTTKEFLRVFEHLYGFINTNFKMDKKYEEEVPRILKSIHYPFTISKSAMFAIGSLHSWPPLLGALHWMVELIRTVNIIEIEQMLFPASFVDDGICKQQEKMFFEYYTKTYQEFMLGKDDFSEANEMLHTAIISQAGCSEDDHEALIDEVAALENEFAKLEAEPDVLEEAIKIKTNLEEKIEQDITSLKELDQQSDVLEQQYSQYQSQIKEEGVDCAQLGDPARQEEIKHKGSEVKTHLERLSSEKARLEQQNCDREMRYSKLYDKFSVTINQYNDISRELALNPRISQYMGENSIALHFDHNQKEMSNLSDTKKRLKPLLEKLANQVADDRYQIEAQKITEEEQLDQLVEMCSEMKCELAQLKAQLTGVDKDLESHKEFLDHEYQSSVGKIREQEDLLSNEHKEINHVLDEEVKELNIKRLEFEDLHTKQMKKQNSYAEFLMKYCEDVVRHKQLIENRVKTFNGLLQAEIKSTEEDQNSVLKMSEE